EHKRQAATQVTVGNIITSMRLLSTLDWREFFESVSHVDPILAGDPVGIYSLMDFATRDRYRHVIEKIAKRTKTSELDIARHAVALAGQSVNPASDDHRNEHVGYYLIDRGRAQLEERAHYRMRLRERILRGVLKHPTASYLGTLSALTIAILAPFLLYASVSGAPPPAL